MVGSKGPPKARGRASFLFGGDGDPGHPAFAPTVQYFRDEIDLAGSYLRHIWDTALISVPDDARRFVAAFERLEQAVKERESASA